MPVDRWYIFVPDDGVHAVRFFERAIGLDAEMNRQIEALGVCMSDNPLCEVVQAALRIMALAYSFSEAAAFRSVGPPDLKVDVASLEKKGAVFVRSEVTITGND